MKKGVINGKPLTNVLVIVAVFLMLISFLVIYSNYKTPTGNVVSGTGSLEITSEPAGALVLVDGAYKGTTPKTVSDLTIDGNHLVQVTKTGYKPVSTTVNIGTYNTDKIGVNMILILTSQTQSTGIFEASSDPISSVYIDNVYRGSTPLTIFGLSLGDHAVKLTKSGYNDYVTTTNIEAGDRSAVSISLTPGSTQPTGTVSCGINQKIGDVNGDGVINSVDSDLAKNVVQETIGMPENICCLDVKQDGQIDSTDSIYIDQIIAGTRQEQGVCSMITTQSLPYGGKGIFTQLADFNVLYSKDVNSLAGADAENVYPGSAAQGIVAMIPHKNGVLTAFNGGGVYYTQDGKDIGLNESGGAFDRTKVVYVANSSSGLKVRYLAAYNDGIYTQLENGKIYYSTNVEKLVNGAEEVYPAAGLVTSIVPYKDGVLTTFGGTGVYYSPDGKNLGGGGNTKAVWDTTANGGVKILYMSAYNGGLFVQLDETVNKPVYYKANYVVPSADYQSPAGNERLQLNFSDAEKVYGLGQRVLFIYPYEGGVINAFEGGGVYYSPSGKGLAGGSPDGIGVYSGGGDDRVIYLMVSDAVESADQFEPTGLWLDGITYGTTNFYWNKFSYSEQFKSCNDKNPDSATKVPESFKPVFGYYQDFDFSNQSSITGTVLWDDRGNAVFWPKTGGFYCWYYISRQSILAQGVGNAAFENFVPKFGYYQDWRDVTNGDKNTGTVLYDNTGKYIVYFPKLEGFTGWTNPQDFRDTIQVNKSIFGVPKFGYYQDFGKDHQSTGTVVYDAAGHYVFLSKKTGLWSGINDFKNVSISGLAAGDTFVPSFGFFQRFGNNSEGSGTILFRVNGNNVDAAFVGLKDAGWSYWSYSRLFGSSIGAGRMPGIFAPEFGYSQTYGVASDGKDIWSNVLWGKAKEAPADYYSLNMDSITMTGVSVVGHPQVVDGKIDKALSFGGSDYLKVTSLPNYYSGKAFSWSAWVRKTTNGDMMIMSHGTGSGGNGAYLNVYNNRLMFTISGSQTEDANNLFPLNEWQLVTATYDGSKMKLYRNGVLVSENSPVVFTSPTRDMIIGGFIKPDTGDLIQSWTGMIDDVRIYSRVLSDAEVSSLAGGRIGGPTRASNFSGLPLKFVPKVGIYHPMGDGRIMLFNSTGQVYFYNPKAGSYLYRGDYTNLTNLGLAGLGANFKPVTGYYFNVTNNDGTLFQGVHLWNAEGVLTSLNLTTGKFSSMQSKSALGLPGEFKPTLGFSSEIGSGRIYLFNSSGFLYIYNLELKKFIPRGDPTNMSNLGLYGFIPTVGYYYKHDINNQGMHLWNASGSLRVLWLPGNPNNFTDMTSSKVGLGLSDKFKPTAGYGHRMNGGEFTTIDLWRTNEVYEMIGSASQFSLVDRGQGISAPTPVGYCNPLETGGNSIPSKTRVNFEGNMLYCDPLTLEFIEAQPKGSTCFNDYECESNSCVESSCQEFATEFAAQGSLLKRIWCTLTSFINNPGNAAQRQTAYDVCIASGVSGG